MRRTFGAVLTLKVLLLFYRSHCLLPLCCAVPGVLAFDEFVLAVAMLCTYSKDQVLHKIFITFDEDASGCEAPICRAISLGDITDPRSGFIFNRCPFPRCADRGFRFLDAREIAELTKEVQGMGGKAALSSGNMANFVDALTNTKCKDVMDFEEFATLNRDFPMVSVGGSCH